MNLHRTEVQACLEEGIDHVDWNFLVRFPKSSGKDHRDRCDHALCLYIRVCASLDQESEEPVVGLVPVVLLGPHQGANQRANPIRIASFKVKAKFPQQFVEIRIKMLHVGRINFQRTKGFVDFFNKLFDILDGLFEIWALVPLVACLDTTSTHLHALLLRKDQCDTFCRNHLWTLQKAVVFDRAAKRVNMQRVVSSVD